MKAIKPISKKSGFTQSQLKFLKAMLSVIALCSFTMNFFAAADTGSSASQKNDVQVKINDRALENIIRKIVLKPKEPLLKSDIINVYNKSKSISYYHIFKWDEFYRTQKGSLNMLFLGSSHAYRTFDPDMYDNELGTHSFNFGESGQYPIADYYQLTEALKYQKPKFIVYELYWKIFELKETTDPKFEHYNFDPLKPNPNKFDPNKYMKDLFEHKITYDSWTKLLKDLNIPIKEYYKDKGYVANIETATLASIKSDSIFEKPDYFPATINKDELSYFNKVLMLCKNNNIKILFVTAPIPPSSMDRVRNYPEIHNYFANIAKTNNSNYIDYNYLNKNGKMFPDDYFMDSNHLNLSGSNALFYHLSNYIKTNYRQLIKN